MASRRDLHARHGRIGVGGTRPKEDEMRRMAVAAVVAMGVSGALAPGAEAAGGPPTYLTTSGIPMPVSRLITICARSCEGFLQRRGSRPTEA